jgi:hypothetical protein
VTLANGHQAREEASARAPAKAIFLYNADSGAVAALLDSLRKLSRTREVCSLCAVTHGMVRKRKAWREVECSLGFPSVYYHRDEMPKDVAKFVQTNRLRLPAVLFAMTGGGFVTAVTAGELGECRTDPRRLRDRIEAARVRLASPES